MVMKSKEREMVGVVVVFVVLAIFFEKVMNVKTQNALLSFCKESLKGMGCLYVVPMLMLFVLR